MPLLDENQLACELITVLAAILPPGVDIPDVGPLIAIIKAHVQLRDYDLHPRCVEACIVCGRACNRVGVTSHTCAAGHMWKTGQS